MHPRSGTDKPRGSMASSFKTHAANLALLCGSLILGYLGIELAFFRLVLPNVTLDVRPYLSETPGVLVQTSKAHFTPKDYVAILGDSNAQGVGDALLAKGGNVARAIHAAHVIRDLTGRDVVSFGRGGSSSAEALVRQPARTLAGSSCIQFPGLSEPRQIFAYFYEGNDLQDNVWFLQKVAARYGSRDVKAIDAYLANQYASFGFWECRLHLGDFAARMVRFLYEFHYRGVNPLRSPAPGGNILRSNGTNVDAPAPLEGPALEVGTEDIQSGAEVFDRSISWLRKRFAQTPITVVYIPAPLSSYHLVGTTYTFAFEPRESNRTGSATPAEITANSDRICALIRGIALHRGVGFLDARPALREAARTTPIHGPVDWGHLNEAGYRALGSVLAQNVGASPATGKCS